MKASPPQRDIIIDERRGLKPILSATAIPIGKTIDTAPTFDMRFVKKIVKRIIISITTYRLSPTVLKIICASHAPAPVLCIPIPRVIAPPYRRMMPQGIRCSTSFQDMQPVKNNRTPPRIAIAANPKY